MKENEMHQGYAAFLGRLDIPYRHDRTDKRTRTKLGEPDFLLTENGHCLFLELKVLGGKISPDQKKRHDYLRSKGNTVVVCYSLEECIEATLTWREKIKLHHWAKGKADTI